MQALTKIQLRSVAISTALGLAMCGIQHFVAMEKLRMEYEKETTSLFVKSFAKVGVRVQPIRAISPSDLEYEMLSFRIDAANMQKLVAAKRLYEHSSGTPLHDYYRQEQNRKVQNLGSLFHQMKQHPDWVVYTVPVDKPGSHSALLYSPSAHEALAIMLYDVS